jgi:DUF917 family protein
MAWIEAPGEEIELIEGGRFMDLDWLKPRENNLPGQRYQRTKRLILTLGMIATQCLMGLYAQQGIRELSEQEVMDLMVGSSIQATRGNDSARMIKRMKEAIEDGKKFTMISVEDLPDSWNVVVPCGVGGGEMWESVTDRLKEQNAPVLRNTALRAVRFLSEYMGKEFNALIRNEPAQSTQVALLTAAELGIPMVDACLSGRARPEVQQQIPFIQGIQSYPVSFVTTWGDRIIIDRAVDDYRVEDLSRAIAIASGGGVWMAMNAMSGETTKKCVIKNNLSQAILFGRTVREACENGQDPIAALVRLESGSYAARPDLQSGFQNRGHSSRLEHKRLSLGHGSGDGGHSGFGSLEKRGRDRGHGPPAFRIRPGLYPD